MNLILTKKKKNVLLTFHGINSEVWMGEKVCQVWVFVSYHHTPPPQ